MSREKQIDEMAKLICPYPQCTYYNIIGGCEARECRIVDNAEKIYNAGYRKQEWFSVDERLPENYEHCLLFLDNETMEIGWYHEVAKKFVVGGLVTINRVTHWMPLPEAPKMKGGAE